MRALRRAPAPDATQSEEDLRSAVPLLAESGPLSLPLTCLRRKALPSVAPGPVVEVGAPGVGVLVAGSAGRQVTIANAGALEVAYAVQASGLAYGWG